MARFTRAEAVADAAASGACGAQSKLSRRSDPKSFFVCIHDPGHHGDHAFCLDGRTLARWKSETSLIEVWLPDGYHII